MYDGFCVMAIKRDGENEVAKSCLVMWWIQMLVDDEVGSVCDDGVCGTRDQEIIEGHKGLLRSEDPRKTSCHEYFLDDSKEACVKSGQSPTGLLRLRRPNIGRELGVGTKNEDVIGPTISG